MRRPTRRSAPTRTPSPTSTATPRASRSGPPGCSSIPTCRVRTLGPWAPGFRRSSFVVGGIVSPAWLSIVADVSGMDGEVPEVSDASRGTAMLAGVGPGLFDGVTASLERCHRTRQCIGHDPVDAAADAGLFERPLEIRPAPGATS